MDSMNLWHSLANWEKSCKWVFLSHELSPETPHWDGFPDMDVEEYYDFDASGFSVQRFSLVSQYGTHVDAPGHFLRGAPLLDTFGPEDMVMPLCVLDLRSKVQQDPDYALSVADILQWEEQYGQIPAGAFVAFNSGWSSLGSCEKMDNRDAQGNKHYPGWSLEAVEFLFSKRGVKAIGHETSDTDPPAISRKQGYVSEICVFLHGRFQIELLKNLDQCPPTGALIFCTFPKVKNASGFTACCFALCPKK